MADDDDFSKTTPAEVVLIVEECKDSVTIAEWACRAIATFTKTAIVTRNREAMAQLLDEGICECLISIMHTHSAGSTVVATHGCQALCDLTKSDRELREFLGDLGACELCVFVLTMHIGRPDVTEPGSGAMINLCTDNIRNSLRLSEAGACDVLVQSGNFGFNLRHPQCAVVAANICDAISHLCEAANQTKLQESGACELIVALFKFHLENDKVCVPATKAFCGLASLTAENREILGRSGGCLLIVQAMRDSKNVQIIENCAESMLHMALSVNNTERLTQAGACVVLMKVLDTVLIDRTFGAEICCGGLMNMVTYGTSSKQNMQSMREAGLVELMGRVQISTRSSYRARDHASQLVAYVNSANGPADGIKRNISASSLSTPVSSPLPGAQYSSRAPSSANSSPSRARAQSNREGQKAHQQSPFFSSFSSFAEKGRRSLGNLSSSTMALNRDSPSNNSSSPLTTIFNNLFDSKNSNSDDNNTKSRDPPPTVKEEVQDAEDAISDRSNHYDDLMLPTTKTTDTDVVDDGIYEI
mmetsp:Transcript_9429/g.17648  ORF Transcript_9429/g.17648 Transcript_9429/m.17648 type:complete len:531 (+) Transcript_9429:120-1712(+)